MTLSSTPTFAVQNHRHSKQQAAFSFLLLFLPSLLFVVLLSLHALPANAATLTVCAQGGQYATIRAAADAANAGDVIQICAGEYGENADFVTTSSSGGQAGVTLVGVSSVVAVTSTVTISPVSGGVTLNAQPADLEPEPEPIGAKRLYLPSLHR